MNAIETDVIVVGGRVAGAATAMLLARQGVRVVLLERAVTLGDTLSTHGFARGGVVQLDRWGLLDEVLAAGTPAIRSVAFHAGGSVIERKVKDNAGVDLLVAPRRRVLDNVLLDAARRAGTFICMGASVLDVVPGRVIARREDGRLQRFTAPLIIGADGMRSRVARCVGARRIEERRSVTGALMGYFTGDWDGFELYAGDRTYSGVFPTNGGVASIWSIARASEVEAFRAQAATGVEGLRRMLQWAAPPLAERLGESVEPVRMAMRQPAFVRKAVGDGWALVGDAGAYRDPITGHGITDALRDAELLANAVLAGDLRAYEEQRDAAMRPVFDTTCAMALLPPLARFVELQKQLSAQFEDEALALASMPAPSATAAA